MDAGMERLAASASLSMKSWRGLACALTFHQRVRENSAVSLVASVSRSLATMGLLPNERAFDARRCIRGLTSLFTKLRLPNRKTGPLLRTVITLALRKRERRTLTGAGRGT